MKTKVLFLGLAIASMASANSQTFNKNNYAFEVGNMAANPSVKSSCNWWLQDNDVFAVTDSKNHTPNGKRSLCFKSERTLEKLKMACGTFNQNGLVELKDGKYIAKCWIFIESGKLKNFMMYFPNAKYKDGKKLAPNSNEKPDFESPYRSSMLKTGWVKPGKWVQVKSEPFHLDGNKEIDMLKAPLHINVPKGTEPVVFYIDDITFEKVD